MNAAAPTALQRPASARASKLVVGAFLAALWTLLLGTWFSWGQFNAADEFRLFSPPPRFDRNLPSSLRAYIHDHFGFRGWLITFNGLLRAGLLHASTSSKVVFGRQGFLFFAGDRSLEAFAGGETMSDCNLESWIFLLERRQAWLASRHIPFLVVIAPDKETVYPEFLPDSIVRAPRTPADVWVEAVRKRSHVPLLDLRPVLIAEKRHRRVFHLTDSHWNPWGAYTAYRAILASIGSSAPGLDARIGPAVSPAGLRTEWATIHGDLNRLLGLSVLPGEKVRDFLPASLGQLSADDQFIVGGTGNPSQPRLVMLRDSFASAVAPFLAPHFSRIFGSSAGGLDPEMIRKEQPDLVIFELVERRLNNPPPIDPDNALETPAKAADFPGLWGLIDEPFNGSVLEGARVRMSGWALADQGQSIREVQLVIDGKPAADMKIHMPRPGVAEAQPGMIDSPRAGVEYQWDSRTVSNGLHRMVWRAFDSAGRVANIARRQFCVAN